MEDLENILRFFENFVKFYFPKKYLDFLKNFEKI